MRSPNVVSTLSTVEELGLPSADSALYRPSRLSPASRAVCAMPRERPTSPSAAPCEVHPQSGPEVDRHLATPPARTGCCPGLPCARRKNPCIDASLDLSISHRLEPFATRPRVADLDHVLTVVSESECVTERLRGERCRHSRGISVIRASTTSPAPPSRRCGRTSWATSCSLLARSTPQPD